MKLEARMFVLVLGLAVLLCVINLVRRRRLKEEFALLWLVLASLLVIAPLAIDLVNPVARFVGIDYEPALLFLGALIVFLFIFFQFSLNISKLSDQIKALTHELALLADRLERVEQESRRSAHDRGDTKVPTASPVSGYGGEWEAPQSPAEDDAGMEGT